MRIVDFDWVDAARGRSVPVRLYGPGAAAQAGPVPLIVFSHGLGGHRRGYSYLGERLSARGHASLHVQHVGSDTSVWLDNPFTLLDRLGDAAHEREAVERARDMSFVLDQVLDPAVSPVGDYVDRRRVFAAGHSYGANTTLLVVEAQVVRDGRKVTYRDPRFKAGIVISAPPFFGEQDLRRVLGAIEVPTLHVTATEDYIRLPGIYSPPQDRVEVYEAVGTPRKALAVFRGGAHSIFSDHVMTGGITLNPLVKEATAELCLAFLDEVFEGNDAPLTDWAVRWKPILAVAPTPFPSNRAPRRRRI